MRSAVPITRKMVEPFLRRALQEDAAHADRTTRALLPPSLTVRARLVAKSSGILAGGAVAQWTFQLLDPTVRCVLACRDGARLTPGQTILTVVGRAYPILAAERTALNILAHLSGIATLTHDCVRRTKPFPVAICDTRKTLPGLRVLEKYAVRMGGGHNHRMGLADAILIKTNHLRAYRGERIAYTNAITQMIHVAQQKAKGTFVEVEVRNLVEFKAALQVHPDAILLDNWPLPHIRKAVLDAKRYPLYARPLLEVSGGITPRHVHAIAKTGVDRISIGSLTHSAPALDVSLEVVGCVISS